MRSAFIKLHIAVFLWGFTGVLGRLITLDAVTLVWYRLIITIISLFILLKLRKELVVPGKKEVLRMFGIGALIGLHWVFFYASIKYSNVSIALTCLSSAGLFTAILEPLYNKRKIDPAELFLGLIGMAGIFLIFHFDSRYQLGIVLGVICTILSCIFSVMNKKVVEKHRSTTMMLYELTGGWILVSLLAPFYFQQFPAERFLPNVSDAGWLLLLSWFCTILAMDLSLKALKHLSAFTQNLTVNLEPVYGIILAFIIYNENKDLSPTFYVGFALIIMAVVLQMISIVYKKRKAAKMANPAIEP